MLCADTVDIFFNIRISVTCTILIGITRIIRIQSVCDFPFIRHTVTIGICCTGGKHRSVYMAEQLGEKLSKTLPESLVVRVKHREKSRW